MPFTIKRLDDKEKIYDLLRQDRLYGAYAIGDLEPALFKWCEWHASSRNGRLTSLCLSFRGMTPHRVFLMGSGQDLVPILEGALQASRAYISCGLRHLGVIRRFYALQKAQLMLRMVLKPERFNPVEGLVTRVGPGDAGPLRDLYR